MQPRETKEKAKAAESQGCGIHLYTTLSATAAKLGAKLCRAAELITRIEQQRQCWRQRTKCCSGQSRTYSRLFVIWLKARPDTNHSQGFPDANPPPLDREE